MIKDDWRSRFRKAAFIFILDPLFQLDGTSSFWFAKGYPMYKDLIKIGDEKTINIYLLNAAITNPKIEIINILTILCV